MSIKRQVEQVQKFLHGWLLEGGPSDSLAPSRVVSLWGLSRRGELHGDTEAIAWETMQKLDSAVEDWAIERGISTTPVDEAHPDAPWGDNIVRKLMIIRGSGRA